MSETVNFITSHLLHFYSGVVNLIISIYIATLIINISITIIFPASALVGAGDNSIHDLYHAHAEQVKQVFKNIDDLAKKHKAIYFLSYSFKGGCIYC